MIVLELGVAFVFCSAVLYGCDVATVWLFANPHPRWAVAIRTFGFLSFLSVIGFYLSAIGFVVAATAWSYVSLSQAMGTRSDLTKVIIVCAVSAGVYAAGFARHRIKVFARRKRFVGSECSLLPHAGVSEPWFVAMQYYALILNRTYKVFITDQTLCGAKIVGLVASPLSPSPGQLDPNDWANTLSATLYERLDVTSRAFLKMNWTNFQIRWDEIARIEFDTSAKWGMGNVPYSGRIFLRLKSGRSKELILLGKQDGEAIRQTLEAAKSDAMARDSGVDQPRNLAKSVAVE